MERKKGLNSIYGVIATVLAILFLLFGGYVLIPLFGEKGALLACVPIALMGVILTAIARTRPSEVFPFCFPPVKSFFGALLLYIGITNATNVYSVILSAFVNISERNDTINAILQKLSPVTALMLTALLPAICEEFFCRGFLVRCFSSIKKKWVLILLIAAIFGAMHLDLVSFIPTAAFGGLMCYIVLKTKSLLLPMLLHFLNNAISVLMAYATAATSSDAAVTVSELYVAQRIAMVIFYGGVSVLAIYIGYRLISGKKFFTKGLAIAVAVAMLLITVGYALLMVGSLKFVHINADTVEYSSEINETLPLNIAEKGNYMVTVTVMTNEDVDVVLCCGDENLKRVSGKNYVQLVYNFEYTEGDCYIKIEDNSEGELKGGSIGVNYIVVRINV